MIEGLLIGVVLGSALTYLIYIVYWSRVDSIYRRRADEPWKRWEKIADDLESKNDTGR